MNEKMAKRLRKQGKIMCADVEIPLATTYEAHPQVVEFDQAYWLRTQYMSTARSVRFDQRHTLKKATKYGIEINWALQELFGDLKINRPQIVLGQCFRGMYQRVKRSLRTK